MIGFDTAHRAVHYPADRRVRLWVRPSVLAVLVAMLAVPLVAAWVQAAINGLSTIPPVPVVNDPSLSWRLRERCAADLVQITGDRRATGGGSANRQSLA